MLDRNSMCRQNRDPETRTHERYLTPAVDIFETEAGLTMIADVPGLNQDKLSIDIDQGVLTIEGSAETAAEEGRLFEEFSVAGYHRQFRLPDSIDSDQIAAELKDGVLTLQLPKAEAAKPKKIAIKTIH